MADTKISALTAASALVGTEAFPAVQSAANVQVTGAQFKAFVNTLDAPITISASGALSSTHYGKIVYVDTAAVALTLPVAPATNQVLRVYNGSAGNITVNSVTVASSKDITYVSIGSAWDRFEPQVTAAASGSVLLPSAYRSGRRYHVNPFANIFDASAGAYANGPAVTANKVFYAPFMLPNNVTISTLGCRVNAAVASANIYLAIYPNQVLSGVDYPGSGAPLANTSAVISGATTGFKFQALAANVSLTGGTLYWAAFISDQAVTMNIDTSSRSVGLGGIAPANVFSYGHSIIDGSTSTPGTWATLGTSSFAFTDSIGNYSTTFFEVA